MPQRRLSVRKIREVLRLRWEQGLSHRQIIESCKLGHGTLADYLRRAEAAGLTWPLPTTLTDTELEARLFPPVALVPGEERPLPDWATVAREFRRKGVTLRLLWQEYQRDQPQALCYSQFCALYRAWRQAEVPRMHQVHVAGDKLFVDYAGQTVPVFDRATGKVREAQIFVATLGASSYTYAEATWSQSLEDWVGSHVRAFAFFGGVPRLLVPDNLKAGVKSPCYYEPDINPTYQELACHYGVGVLPARVRKPRDKAKVENGVQQVERWVLAPLRNCQFFSLAELNAALREPVDQLNHRPAPGLPASRWELFETLDRPALRPLPPEPFELATWKRARVNIDCHVQVDGHFYSVPYQLVRHEIEVRLTATCVEAYSAGERVASHGRSHQRWGYTTVADHLPPSQRAQADQDPYRLLSRARVSGGPATEELCRRILAGLVHPEQGYRGCLGILSLARKHGSEPLEQASRRALHTGAHSYKSVQSILKKGLQNLPLPEAPAPATPIHHTNVRGPGYYQNQEEAPAC